VLAAAFFQNTKRHGLVISYWLVVFGKTRLLSGGLQTPPIGAPKVSVFEKRRLETKAYFFGRRYLKNDQISLRIFIAQSGIWAHNILWQSPRYNEKTVAGTACQMSGLRPKANIAVRVRTCPI
jgi:hypothetical protein